jgi:hypothetical protein
MPEIKAENKLKYWAERIGANVRAAMHISDWAIL